MGRSADLVASSLKEVIARYGPDAFMGLSSAKTSNEDNYLFQKLVRHLGTITSIIAPASDTLPVAGLATAFGSGAMTNSIEEITGAQAILVIGSNTTETHLRSPTGFARPCARSVLIVADPRKSPWWIWPPTTCA